MQFDLRKEFPILSSKHVAFKTAVKELLWIWQKQSNDVRELQKMGCHVWDEWMREDGTIGKEFLNKRAIKFISQNRLLTLNIHELYILFSSDKFQNIDSTYIVEDMKMLTSFTDQNIKELLDKIEDHIKKSENIYNKMMLENIREVYKEIHKINKYIG